MARTQNIEETTKTEIDWKCVCVAKFCRHTRGICDIWRMSRKQEHTDIDHDNKELNMEASLKDGLNQPGSLNHSTLHVLGSGRQFERKKPMISFAISIAVWAVCVTTFSIVLAIYVDKLYDRVKRIERIIK